MTHFNDTVINLFRQKADFEELAECTIYRSVDGRVPELIIESYSEEVLSKLWKNYRVLARTARECGFYGYLIFRETGRGCYSPPVEIEEY